MIKRHFHYLLIVTLLSACAMEFETTETTVSEDEAFNVLKSVPLKPGLRSIHGKTARISGREVTDLLGEMVKSGRLDSNPKVAALLQSGNIDLSTLESIFALLQGGSVNSIWGLVQGLLALDPGTGGSTGSSLDSIMALIQAALPIVAMFAPQFVPILQAIIVIAPVIIRIIELIGGKAKKAAFSSGLEFSPLVFASNGALLLKA